MDIGKLAASDFPGIDKAKFNEWKALNPKDTRRLGQKMRDYTQVQVDGLIALARSVSFRPFETDKDLNFPG